MVDSFELSTTLIGFAWLAILFYGIGVNTVNILDASRDKGEAEGEAELTLSEGMLWQELMRSALLIALTAAAVVTVFRTPTTIPDDVEFANNFRTGVLVTASVIIVAKAHHMRHMRQRLERLLKEEFNSK